MQRRDAMRCKNDEDFRRNVEKVNDIGNGRNDSPFEGKTNIQQSEIGRKTNITWVDVCVTIDYIVMTTLYLFNGLFLTTLFIIYGLH